MKVVIETPYTHDVVTRQYLQDCLRDSLRRGEDPITGRTLYVGRTLYAPSGWQDLADARIFCLDRGFSHNMASALRHAISIRQPIYIRGLALWRGERRIEALRRLNGEIGSRPGIQIDWAGF